MNKKSKITEVSETNIGIYVWRLPDGSFLHDGNALNVLSIEALRGDIKAMGIISNTAKSYGYDGSPVFVEGLRKLTDEEFEEQLWRMKEGLTPDSQDIGVYNDKMRGVG